MSRAPSTRPATLPAVKTAGALASLLSATELSIERSKAYHASENLTTAYGYDIDEASNAKSPDFLTLHQIVQPVIHVSTDGKSAKIRVRLFQMSGPSGGEGSWTSGIYESASVDEGGSWKLSAMELDRIWSAPSRGGWARVTTPPRVPFHYKNPVSGRVPPLLLP